MAISIGQFMFELLFGVDKGAKAQVEGELQALKEMASNLLGKIGIAFSISGLYNAINGCVQLASNVEEMQNKFDVVFAGLTDEVEAWASDFADAIGRNKNDIKGYVADMQNLLVGFMGQDRRKEAAEMSKSMTQLAMDLASFANLDEAYAVEAMTNAVMGETESAKSLGAVLNDLTRAQAMQELGLSGTYDALDQVAKMQVNYQAILDQSADAVGDCERSVNSYKSTLTAFQSKLTEIRTIIGQFFMPTFSKVLRFGSQGLAALRDWLGRLTELADRLGGADRVISMLAISIGALMAILNFQKIITGVKTVTSLLAGPGIKLAALLAVIILVALAVEDLVRFVQGKDSVIGTLFEKAGLDAEAAREKILAAWEQLKTAAANLYGKLKEAFSGAFEAIGRWWDENGDSIISHIGTILYGLIDVIASIIETIANLLNGDWAAAWESANQACYQFSQTVMELLGWVWEGIVDIFSPLVDWMQRLWNDAKNAVSTKVSEIRQSIVDGFTAAIDWIKSLPGQAIQWGSDFVQGLIDGIQSKVQAVIDSVAGIAGKIRSYLHFSVPDEGPLTDYESWMPDFMTGLAKGIQANLPMITSAMKKVSAVMTLGVQPTPATVGTVAGSGGSGRVINQNVNINNQFHGDVAGQKKSAEAMKQATDDTTAELARAIEQTR